MVSLVMNSPVIKPLFHYVFELQKCDTHNFVRIMTDHPIFMLETKCKHMFMAVSRDHVCGLGWYEWVLSVNIYQLDILF